MTSEIEALMDDENFVSKLDNYNNHAEISSRLNAIENCPTKLEFLSTKQEVETNLYTIIVAGIIALVALLITTIAIIGTDGSYLTVLIIGFVGFGLGVFLLWWNYNKVDKVIRYKKALVIVNSNLAATNRILSAGSILTGGLPRSNQMRQQQLPALPRSSSPVFHPPRLSLSALITRP